MPRKPVNTNYNNDKHRASHKETLCRLILLLFEKNNEFFSHDYLNSEGRKLFEKIVEIVLEMNPEYGKRIIAVRKKGSREEVASFLNEVGEKYQCW